MSSVDVVARELEDPEDSQTEPFGWECGNLQTGPVLATDLQTDGGGENGVEGGGVAR